MYFFTWQDYLGNGLFSKIYFINGFLIYLFVFLFYSHIMAKFKKKSVLKGLLVIFILFFIAFISNLLLQNIASLFDIYVEPTYCIGMCGSYEELRSIYGAEFIEMVILLFLNFGHLYFNIISKKFKNKKKSILIYLIIGIVFALIMFGVYQVMDYYAPNFELYG